MHLFEVAVQSEIMKISRSKFGKALWLVLFFPLLAGYLSLQAFSYPTGVISTTNKPRSSSHGCSCHCDVSDTLTIVKIYPANGDTIFHPGMSYAFKVSVENSNEVRAGVNVATYKGTFTAGTDGLSVSSGELYQRSSKSIVSSAAVWSFTYKAPMNISADTIYATGNAVNGDGGADCQDSWNWAPKFIVNLMPVQAVASSASVITNSLTISPNPSSLGEVQLQLHATHHINATVLVYDDAGREVVRMNDQPMAEGVSTLELNTSKLPSGEYFVHLLDGGNTIAQTKLVVAR